MEAQKKFEGKQRKVGSSVLMECLPAVPQGYSVIALLAGGTICHTAPARSAGEQIELRHI